MNRHDAEDIADGGPLGGGPDGLVDRIVKEGERVVAFLRDRGYGQVATVIEKGEHRGPRKT